MLVQPPARQFEETPSVPVGAHSESIFAPSLLREAKSPAHPTTTWFQLIPYIPALKESLR